MTIKNIQHKAPYIANTFNNKDYLAWGYDDPAPSGGRMSGLSIAYTGGRYLAQPGTWISRGSYGTLDNAGVVIDQQDAIEMQPVSAGSASNYRHVFYGFLGNATGSANISYGVLPYDSPSLPSGYTVLAQGTSNTSGIVTSWASERSVGVAGHVYAPQSSAHAARQIFYDNSVKNWAGNPDNVQDAIDLIPSKISFPSEIEWCGFDNITGMLATTNVPIDPTPLVYPGSWLPSANKTVALVGEVYIPGGLITEFLRIQGQFTARAVSGVSNGYTKWGVAVELVDDLTGANGVYHYAETMPLTGGEGEFAWGTCDFNFMETFSGSANLRKVAKPVCSYQLLTTPRTSFSITEGTSLPSQDRVPSSYIPNSEKLFWRNAATKEWAQLTRNKDYTITTAGVVTFERPLAGYIYYTYRLVDPDIGGVVRDVRADNGLRAFIYIWCYGDGNVLTGSYGSQPTYDSGWWAGGIFDRTQFSQSLYGISFVNHIRGFQIAVSLR